MNTRGRGPALAVLLVLAAGVGAWLVAARTVASPSDARSAQATTASLEPSLEMVENSFRAIEDGVRTAPRDRWDPAYVVEQIGRDPDSLAAWVGESTSWVPYRGALRGPVGVLMDRQGNSLDRALLLSALLAEAGHAARIARADLPSEKARALLPALVAQRAVASLDELVATEADAAPAGDFAARYELDGGEIERALDGFAEGTTRLFAELDRRVPEQARRLLASIASPEPDAEWLSRRDSAIVALADHWWVQVQRGDSWADLDPIGVGGADMGIAPLETMLPSEIEPTLHHTISIRVVAERLAAGALTEQVPLSHAIRPGDLIGRPIVLQFWPAAWPNRAPVVEDLDRSTRQIALSQDTWTAALVIGTDVVASGGLTAASSGAAGAPAPAPGFGGLGGAISQGLGGREPAASGRPDSLLTAVWIEYRIDVPGHAPRTVRRAVFDLIGEAARQAGTPQVSDLSDEQRLTRSLSLMMRTEILPVVAGIAPEFVLQLHGRSLLANADLVRAASRGSFGSNEHTVDSLLRLSEPVVSPLYTLAVLRREGIGATAFIDRPAILTRHQFPSAHDEGLALEDATDIVANELGVALTEEDGFAARLRQGVWDTNLEGLLAGSRASANTALAYAASDSWRTVSAAGQARDPGGLEPNAAALLQRDLQDGYTVVAPGDPVVLQDETFSGWWRIDPETGDALGIAGTGWGQAAPDYGMHLAAFVEMAKPFVFTYALCQYIPQAANSLNILGNEFWRLGIAPGWTTPPAEGRDFEDVAAENNRRCVIDAIIGGFVATAPLLLRTMMYRQAALGSELRMSRVNAGAFRTRPSMRRSPPIRMRNPGRAPPPPARGPAGTLPSGRTPPANPLGGTEPGIRPGGPPSAPSPSGGARGSGGTELAAEGRAQQNFDKAMRDYYQQINNWIEAKSANPGMGANERQAYDRMVRNAERTAWERGQELESARTDAKPFKQSVNERATVDGGNQLQQSGLGMSFWKITWPN